MRALVGTTFMTGSLLVAGCISPVAGTWKVAPDQPAGRMTFGAMTLAHDGTFTAEAKYENQTQVMTGCYKFANGELVFCSDGQQRTYGATLKGDELIVMHKGTALKMARIKCCCGGKCGKCGGTK